MEYHEYKVKGKVDLYKFTNYSSLANEIKKTLPEEEKFKIETHVDGGYLEKGSNKGKKVIQLTLKISIGNDKDHEKEFKEIKNNLENLLDCKLIEHEI